MTPTLALLVVYSVLLVGIGLWVGRRVRGGRDFFVASQLQVRPGVADTQAVLARELSGGSGDGARLFRQATTLGRDIERARIEDGMRILDLGCGWGSFTLYAAERFPAARITAVSNSQLQREWIEARAPANVEVLTLDVNDLCVAGPFDRVVSVEMFEHMRNYELLLARLAALLSDDGLLFVHLFCHRELAYAYTDGWMARNFFTAGTMPVASMIRSRCSGWKFDTPTVRRRPPVTSSVIAFQVET